MSETSTTSRQLVLAPGQADQMIPVAVHGSAPLSGLWLRAGDKPLAVVADDSDEDGIGESLAKTLVDRGLAEYVNVLTGKEVTLPVFDASTVRIRDEAPRPASAAVPVPEAAPITESMIVTGGDAELPNQLETEAENEQTHLNNAEQSE